jgi:hypothetical protein
MSEQAIVQNQIMARPTVTPIVSGVLQRQCACGQHTSMDGECEECKQEREAGMLQRAAIQPAALSPARTLAKGEAGRLAQPSDVPPIMHEVLRWPSQPLDSQTRAFMEPRFGHDFSQIRTYAPAAGVIQTKLAINKPGDEYEQEADRVADQVLAASAHSPVGDATLRVQRFAGQATEGTTAPASVDRALASPGKPLESVLRQDMEQRFGYDFSRVRVHSGANAEQSARDLNAHAYTVGQNIVFGTNQFAPATYTGQRLLAHELTHVVQQSSEAPLVQRSCYRPADLTGDSECTTLGGDITDVTTRSDELFLFRISCDDFLTSPVDYEARLRDFVSGIELGDTVSIHGFASEEGPPEFNERLSCQRARTTRDLLSSLGITTGVTVFAHGAVAGYRPEHRSVVVHVEQPERRAITRGEQDLLDRLARLGRVAHSEGSGGPDFALAVDDFRSALTIRMESLNAGDPLPDDVQVIMKALLLWSNDPGNQWGEGTWDSTDLAMTAPDYALVPASQYKCNAYVAEVLNQSLGLVFRVHESEQTPGRYFPYRASEWGDASLSIPHFAVTSTPQMGDIWSNGSHTGIYLGEYGTRRLYISARDDGNGVFGLEDQVQRQHGIQIKYLPDGGVYRHYTP